MSQSIGNIQLDLGINSSGFKRQLNGISKTAKAQTGSMAGMFGKLGAVMAATFAIGKIITFSKACIQLGSDLAEVQNVVDVTYGSMSNKVNEFARNAMESYGLSEKVAKQYMGTFGAMSKAFGYTTDAAYEQAAALTGLAGDVASFYNLTTDEAYTKLKSVFTGETESLKDLGVVMTQTALDEYALQKGMGKTTANMSEQEKVALRLAFVQDRLATASGDFARTSDGWANQTRVLALRFDALKASIGQGLISALLPIVRVLNDIIGYAQAAADAFRDFSAALFGDTGSSSSAASSMSTASADLATNMAQGAGAAAAIKKSLAGFDQLNILSSSSSAGSSGSSGSTSGISSEETTAATESGNKYVAVLDTIKQKMAEIAELSGLDYAWDGFLTGINGIKNGLTNIANSGKKAIGHLTPEIDKLKTSLSNTFTSVSTTLTTVWGDMWTSLGTNFEEFTVEYGPQIEDFLYNVGLEFTNFGTLASTAINDIFGGLKSWWETDGSRIFDEISGIISDLGGTILTIWNEWIHPVVQEFQTALSELWTNNLKPLWDEILSLVTSVWNVIKMFWDGLLKPLIDWLVARFGPQFVNAFSTTFKIVKDLIAGLIDTIKGIIKSIRGILDFVTGVFTGNWKKAWTGIKTFFAGIWDSSVSLVKTPINLMIGLFEGLVNAVVSAVNGIIRAVNKLNFDVPDWVPGIGGKKFGFNLKEVSKLSIPRLATGGYVAANSPQLAIIGDNKREGEIVAPESKIAEAVAAGVAAAMRQFIGLMNNKTGQNTPIVIKIGEDDVWSGFIDYHNSVVKRTGDSPLLI